MAYIKAGHTRTHSSNFVACRQANMSAVPGLVLTRPWHPCARDRKLNERVPEFKAGNNETIRPFTDVCVSGGGVAAQGKYTHF